MLSRAFAVLMVATLGACDSDNVSWAFVSNPGGPPPNGGAIIIIRYNSSGTSPATSTTGSTIHVGGSDERGPVGVWLPLDADVAALERDDGVELRSPLSDPAARWLPGAKLTAPATGPIALRLDLPDAVLLHESASGPGTLHVAAAGNLLVLESSSGLVVFGERDEPEVLPLSIALTTAPDDGGLVLLGPDGAPRQLVPQAPAGIGQRLRHDRERDVITVLGPRGEALAEIPAGAARLHDGAGGLFLSAELPGRAFLTPRGNRHLLRIDG